MHYAQSDPTQPVIWAVSRYRLIDVVRQVAPEFESRSTVSIIHRGYEDALAEIERRSRTEACDVIVAAGEHGIYLRRHVTQPVAMVKVGGSDLLAAMSKARQISDRIAILMYKHMPAELNHFASLFKLPLALHAYETPEEARHRIRQLARSGIKVVVGPGLIADLADEEGLTGVLIYSADSVRAAFEDAIDLAASQRAEKSRRTQLDLVLHHLNDGVVAIDMAGRVVTANPAMDKLTGLPVRAALGRHLQDILPDLQLGQVMTRSQSEIGVIQELAGKSIVVDRVPLFDDGRQTGAILTLHGSNQMELAVSKLRAHTHRRSRVARYRLDDLVAASPEMQQLTAQCRVFARRSDAGILISGESGTGKEMLAQGIHNESRRASHPFIVINCGAFTETLLESELFGYEEGAFTGARKQGKAGLFEAADGGTLFLDEIGEMPLPLQTRLLRALQEKEITRVGSVDPIPVDVRVVAATHRDLAAMVERGRFREDLFYRLNILRVRVPPLRERTADIEVLVERHVQAAFERSGIQQLAGDVLRIIRPLMLAHPWHGNVRELENVVERLAMTCLANGRPIRRGEVGALLDSPRHRPPAEAAPSTGRSRESDRLEEAERVLRELGGDHQATARRLGVSRTTLWRILHRK